MKVLTFRLRVASIAFVLTLGGFILVADIFDLRRINVEEGHTKGASLSISLQDKDESNNNESNSITIDI